MSDLAAGLRPRLTALLGLAIMMWALGAHASGSRATIETAKVSGEWGVWSDWYWPFSDTDSPNLYGANECMSRYDAFAGASSQSWEEGQHGPALNPADWVGHCHAWAGASVWEGMPTTNRVCGGVTFRPRDQAGLMIECYYNDTLATEINEYLPSPGLFWRYLRQEIMGENPMHGHAMALIGNLSQTAGQVWNFPIYEYEVSYTLDSSGSTYSGTMTVWFADDGNPSYATSLGLTSISYAYPFSAVSLDTSGLPVDSGSWGGSAPSQCPTSLWRPYCAVSWTNYAGNPELDGPHLAQILEAVPTQCTYSIATSASPLGGGSAGPGGTANCGSSVTLCASPNAGYSFANWTENGSLACSTLCYTFTANTNRNLVANFSLGIPVLSAARAANQAVIRWGTNWPDYQLEFCTNARFPQVWSPVTSTPSMVGSFYSVTDPIVQVSRFYRLQHP
jgi:hypothetical protein